MILINVRFKPLPEYVDNFRELVDEFTTATRAEEGCIFFDWARNTDDPSEYLLNEAFQDDAAEAHVNSDHFAEGLESMRPLLRETPYIVSQSLEGKDGWDRMGELEIN